MEAEYFFSFTYLLICIFILKYFYKYRMISIISPVDMFVLFFITVIVLNYLYIYYPEDQKFNMYNLDVLNEKKFCKQMNVFLRMMTLFLTGVLIYTWRNKNFLKVSSKKIEIFNIENMTINNEVLKHVMLVLLCLCCVLVVFDLGFDLFYRVNYIPQKSSAFKSIYTILLIVLSILAAISYDKYRTASTLSIVVVLLIGIGLGSRMATVNLTVFVFTYSFLLKSKVAKFKYFLIWMPVIVLFFGYNIALRKESNTHGIVPYLGIIIDKPEVIFKNTLFNIYYTFIFGFVATSQTIKLYHENLSNLLTCINPLPGSLTNWYLFAQKMRINKYAPYTAIGELANFPFFSFFYYIFLGYYFSLCDFYIKTLVIAKKYLAPAIVIILLDLFIMFSFEYNLRSSVRYLYYSALVVFLSKNKVYIRS